MKLLINSENSTRPSLKGAGRTAITSARKNVARVDRRTYYFRFISFFFLLSFISFSFLGNSIRRIREEKTCTKGKRNNKRKNREENSLVVRYMPMLCGM